MTPSAEKITGYSREEFLSDPDLLDRIVLEEDRKTYYDHIERFHNGSDRQVSSGCEYRIIHRDGGVRWIQHRCEPILSEEGEYLGRQVANRGITQQREMQKERDEFLQLLEKLVQGTNHGVLLETVDRKLILANDRFREIFRVPPDVDIRGVDGREGIRKSAMIFENSKSYDLFLDDTLAEGVSSFGKQIDLNDGSHMEVDFIPVYNEGVQTHCFWLYRDVTDQVNMAEKVRQSRKNLDNFFQMNRDFLWVLEENGNIVTVNSTVTKRLGYSEEELKGRSVLRVHPEDRQEEAERILGEMLQGKVQTCPIPILTKSGVQIPVETYVMPGEWDGKPAVFGVSKDITELKLSEEKFAKAFNTSPAIIGLSDLETEEYIEVNPEFYKILGYERAEVIGNKVSELLKFDPEWWERVLSRMMEQGYVKNEETMIRTKDGRSIPILLSAEVISLQDRTYNFTTAIDISDLKKALAEKDFLMRELNHRIKNNLIILSSLIDLKDDELGPDVDISDIKHEINAIRIVHEKLYQSKSQQCIEMRSYIQSLLETIFSSFSQHPVTIENGLEEIQVNPSMAINLGLIINELAINAIKHGFRREESAAFSIVTSTDPQSEKTTFIVTNSGSPFPEDRDLESPTTLGLLLVTRLVEQLGGTIELVRSPTPVFTFTVSLAGN